MSTSGRIYRALAVTVVAAIATATATLLAAITIVARRPNDALPGHREG